MKQSSKMTVLSIAMGIALFGGDAASVASASDTETRLKGALKFASEDGNFKFQVGGRLQADAAWYNEDNIDLDGENGTEFRRARVFISGTMYRVWDWKAQYDFASSDTIKDAYIRYTGFKPVRITVGNFKQPSSLEELTSSKYITFMERALPNTFSTGRRIGLAGDYRMDNLTLTASVYGQDANDNGSGGDEGYGVGARGTFAPINEKGRVLHLGAWGAWEQVSDNSADTDKTIRFRQRPESHITSSRLVNTGTIADSDNVTKWGLEAAGVMGPFSVQGEYMMASVDSGAPGLSGDPEFGGWYAFASYILTGESRPYKKGAFGRIKPKHSVGAGGTGAWEVAVRYSNIDLKDSGIDGGEEDNITLGVNWYATPYVRFSANYIKVDADLPGGGNDEPGIFQARAQIDF